MKEFVFGRQECPPYNIGYASRRQGTPCLYFNNLTINRIDKQKSEAGMLRFLVDRARPCLYWRISRFSLTKVGLASFVDRERGRQECLPHNDIFAVMDKSK